MSSNFNPEDLYKSNQFQGDMDDEYSDAVDIYDVPTNNNQLVGNTFGKQPLRSQYIPQYHIQTMPTQSSISLLENDVNKLFETDTFNDPPRMHDNNEINNENDGDGDGEPSVTIDKDFNVDYLVENNITEKKFDEILQDHYVVVDSIDRNIDKYPNPFSYKVFFNAFNSIDANITRNFDRVKSVSLESGILPMKYYFLKRAVTVSEDDNLKIKSLEDISRNQFFNLMSTDISGSFAIIDVVDVINDSNVVTRHIKFATETEYPIVIEKVYETTLTFDIGTVNIGINSIQGPIYEYSLQTFNLMEDKYNLLYVDEFSYANEYSTNEAVKESFSIMFPDCKNNNVYYTASKFKDKVYTFNNLGNINKMSISIRDSTGTQLKNSFANYLDLEVPRDKKCTCSIDTDGYFVRDYRCSCSYFRHPYYHHFQNTMIFKIKAYEINIDKKIFN